MSMPTIYKTMKKQSPEYWQKLREKSVKKWKEKQKPKPIAKRSKKRAAQEREYSKRVKKWKLENPICKANLSGCTGKTVDCHHMAGKIGNLLTDESNWLPVCRNCHNWITDNSKQAIELGLSKSRLKNT